jgi:hypothetical protein
MSWYIEKGVPPFTQEGYEVTNKKNESYWFQTREWAELCQEHFNRLESINVKEINYSDDIIYRTTDVGIHYTLDAPEHGEWVCHLFGSNGGITLVPRKDQVPNWFWRKMQYLILGNKWVKK